MKKGDTVEWISQAMGSWKEKRGTVIEEVPAGKSAMKYIPLNTKKSHIKFQDKSLFDRVLVAVHTGKDKKMIHYYCPSVNVVGIVTKE